MAAPVAQVVGEYLSEAASSKLRAKHKLKKQVVAEEEERCWRGCGTGELAAQLRLRRGPGSGRGLAYLHETQQLDFPQKLGLAGC